jgi:hypothetical protein
MPTVRWFSTRDKIRLPLWTATGYHSMTLPGFGMLPFLGSAG